MSLATFNQGVPQGTQEQNCSPGNPIGGFDSNNIFRILKLNADGTLPTSSNLPITTVPFEIAPRNQAATVGIKAVNTVFFNRLVTPSAISAGQYIIDPFLIYGASVLGTINFMLIKTGGTTLDLVTTALVFGDTVAGIVVGDFETGLGGFWHNNAGQLLTPDAAITYNNNSPKSVYLQAGQYRLLAYVNTAVTLTAIDIWGGFNQFSKIS